MIDFNENPGNHSKKNISPNKETTRQDRFQEERPQPKKNSQEPWYSPWSIMLELFPNFRTFSLEALLRAVPLL